MLSTLSIIPFSLMGYLAIKRESLGNPDYRKKYGSFYPGVHLKRYK